MLFFLYFFYLLGDVLTCKSKRLSQESGSYRLYVMIHVSIDQDKERNIHIPTGVRKLDRWFRQHEDRLENYRKRLQVERTPAEI